MDSNEDFLKRLIELCKKFENAEDLKSNLSFNKGKIAIDGTDIEFSRDEILSIDSATGEKSANKIAQSDVPDNMLSLLTALKAITTKN